MEAADRLFYAMEAVQEEDMVPVPWSAARELAPAGRDFSALEGEHGKEREMVSRGGSEGGGGFVVVLGLPDFRSLQKQLPPKNKSPLA
jgi:hypothetical protein